MLDMEFGLLADSFGLLDGVFGLLARTTGLFDLKIGSQPCCRVRKSHFSHENVCSKAEQTFFYRTYFIFSSMAAVSTEGPNHSVSFSFAWLLISSSIYIAT